MWKSEVLVYIPESGVFEENYFGGNSGTFSRVKFYNDYLAWVGVFQNGQGKNVVKSFINEEKAIVLSNGLIYRIDINQRKLLSISDKNDFLDIIADTDLIFAADYTTIHVIKEIGLVKIIQGYYFDGFKFESIDTNKVYCTMYQIGGDWETLTIDRATLEIDK